jgi:hypothetical protein
MFHRRWRDSAVAGLKQAAPRAQPRRVRVLAVVNGWWALSMVATVVVALVQGLNTFVGPF